MTVVDCAQATDASTSTVTRPKRDQSCQLVVANSAQRVTADAFFHLHAGIVDKVIRNGQPVNSKLSTKTLSSDEFVMVSAAAVNKPDINADLCKPASFVSMPSIAYRLTKVAAGDGVCGVSLYPVSAHDVVAGHALLRGAGGVLLDDPGEAITYVEGTNMQSISRRCFGGSLSACLVLVVSEWDRIFSQPTS